MWYPMYDVAAVTFSDIVQTLDAMESGRWGKLSQNGDKESDEDTEEEAELTEDEYVIDNNGRTNAWLPWQPIVLHHSNQCMHMIETRFPYHLHCIRPCACKLC